MEFIKKLKESLIAQWIKNSKIYRCYLTHTQGDWCYPFIFTSWKLAKILVPRRKVSINNIAFTLSCTNWVTHFRWYLFKTKESEVRRYIDNYVKDGDVFFDIGANIGVFSIYCGKRVPNTLIYCFEPEYSNLHTLKENIIYNGLRDNTRIYSVAIGNFTGVSNLYLQDFSEGSALHTENKEDISVTQEGCPVVWAEGIMSVTLDYICEQLGVVPNVLKIDTDGNEDKVLEGAIKTLSDKALKSLVIEISRDAKKESYCRKMLSSAGFNLAWSDRKKTCNEIWVKI